VIPRGYRIERPAAGHHVRDSAGHRTGEAAALNIAVLVDPLGLRLRVGDQRIGSGLPAGPLGLETSIWNRLTSSASARSMFAMS
jgi:hypothetical protein